MDDLAALARFQQQFLNRLYFEQPIDAVQLRDGLQGGDGERGLRAYKGSLYGILNKALAEIYPVCRQFVGADFFDALAGQYIRCHPSRVDRLDDYGESLAAFIGEFPPARSVPQLAALAELEWAWQRAFHAANANTFDFEGFAQATALGKANGKTLRFSCRAGLSLLQADFPVDRLWQFHQPDWPEDETVDLAEGPVKLVVYRPDRQVYIERLNDDRWQLLQLVMAGATLPQICDRLGEQAALLLPLALQCGWLEGFQQG
ncbi:HvfC/BufC N-terminal domain-containing protein [Marinobacterium arenosum]|uniref:HvfC/BufC N-terminal domain-containing protein n=1 Tax=Marinobacterium arenosum TaxID=2862496 RepID=UPI001C94B9A5|nr:DNA-binding domain-containing protein [Marinobacterium arenosum]MBY4678075.1 DNA-binding domain-containing protein [Marinobacterium arenosum]